MSSSHTFTSLGDFLIACRDYSIIGGRKDPRLQSRGNPLGGSEQVPADGGFLVPPEWSRRILERAYLQGSIISRCFQLPLTSNSLTYPVIAEQSRVDGSRFGGVQAFWQNEADNIIASKPKFGRGELVAKKIICIVYLTNELYADTEALSIWGESVIAKEIAFKIEDSIINGDGAGKPQGIAHSQTLIEVPKQSEQASGTIVGQNIVDMYARLWAPSRRSAVLLCHPDAENQIITSTINVGTGGSAIPLYQSSSDEDKFNTCLGRPVLAVEYMATPGNPMDCCFCDLSRYALAFREAAQQAVSIHVAFTSDQSALRVTARLDGAPIDQFPLQQFQGTNTVSPFTCIAERS